MARAEKRGHLVLAGAASELERDLPFSLFVDALDEYLEGLEPSVLDGLDDGVIGELAGVFPSLTSVAAGAPVSGVHERYRSHRAVRALLECLAKHRPLVLLLDDLHWADAASTELFGALLRRPPATSVLMAVAFRPRRMPRPFLTELERAHRAEALTQLELAGLTPVESRELLGEGVDPTMASALYEESDGNPFYLEQLARSLDRAHEGRVPGKGITLADIEVPPAVLASLSEEIAVLSDPGRLVLEGAAVAGDPFDLELAAAAAAVSEGTALDGVDELLRHDLVRITDVPRRFRFRHPLVRRTVYEGAPGAWRLVAHERCAGALTSRGATAAARAHHVELSAKVGDLAAVATLSEAGQEAVRLAPSSAARWFGAALRLLPSSAPSEERVALLEARAGSLAAIGSFSESRADLLDCLEIMPRDVWDRRVRVTTACAVVEHLLGLQKEAHRHLTTALAEVGDPESVEGVELKIALAVNAFHAVDFDAMRDWAGRAVGGAMALGEHSVLAAALAARAWSEAMAGDTGQAQIFCDEATDLVDSLSDDELAPRLITLEYLASADLYLDRYPATTRHAQRALDIGHATGQELFPQVVSMLGTSLGVQGEPLEAGKLFDEAVEAARLSGNTQSLATHLFSRSFAALLAGDLDLARVTGEESFDIEQGMEPSPLSTLAAAVLASVTLELGQADRSVDLLLTSAGGAELRQLGGSWRARYLEVLTRALLAAGRPSDAERVVALAQDCAETVGLPTAEAMASLATANLALYVGEPAAAAERALAAADAFESVGALTDAAWARELAGRSLTQAGQTDNAAVELGRAAAAFESFGALRYRDQAEHELRRLGRRVHRRSRQSAGADLGIESLTERELQVARLVVDRRTNPEIATELFISQKTVETHLRNIFHKMNVTTRVELARAVEGADRLTTVST
jgi:DNA-binding CsgD family transcriptional regulator